MANSDLTPFPMVPLRSIKIGNMPFFPNIPWDPALLDFAKIELKVLGAQMTQQQPIQTETLFEDGIVKVVRRPYSSYGVSRIIVLELLVDGVSISQSGTSRADEPPFKGSPFSFVKQRLKSKIASLTRKCADLDKIKAQRDKLQAELDRLTK